MSCLTTLPTRGDCMQNHHHHHSNHKGGGGGGGGNATTNNGTSGVGGGVLKGESAGDSSSLSPPVKSSSTKNSSSTFSFPSSMLFSGKNQFLFIAICENQIFCLQIVMSQFDFLSLPPPKSHRFFVQRSLDIADNFSLTRFVQPFLISLIHSCLK